MAIERIPLNLLDAESIKVDYNDHTNSFQLSISRIGQPPFIIDPISVKKDDSSKNRNESSFSIKVEGNDLVIHDLNKSGATRLPKSKEYTNALVKSNFVETAFRLQNLPGPSDAVISLIGVDDYRALGPKIDIPIGTGEYEFEFEKHEFSDKLPPSAGGDDVEVIVTIFILRIYGPK